MEPLAVMVSVMTVLATPTAPERTLDPIMFPQVMTARECPKVSEDAKTKLVAQVHKDHGIRVVVMTKCVGVSADAARLMRISINALLDGR